MDSKDYKMDFLSENENEIIRNLKEPEEFIEDSFQAISMGVGITLIVGMPKDKSLIEDVLNPEKLCVQAVKFKKPDWSLEDALDWLSENQKHFKNYQEIKTYAKKDLKSINGVEIFSAGTWNGDKYTTKDLDLMVEAFNETQENVRPFLKLGHSDKQKILEAEGLPAAGWIGKLYRKGEKLIADFVDIPNKIYELIENKAYRKVSSEIYLGVQIKDKKYNYMLGAVALLGAETPAVMNLSDILARFGLKSYESIKNYADNKSDVKSIEYSINNNNQGDYMSKTEKEMELELKLNEANETLNAKLEELKQFQADLEAKETQIKEIQDAKQEAEKKAFEMEKEAYNTKIEKQADELLNAGLISKSMRPYAVALLKNEVNEETKKYSLKLEKEEKELERFELIKEFSSLAKKTSDVNFEDNSEDGEKKVDEVEDFEKVEKYAADNDVSLTEAYKALYAGKLKVERPNIEEQ
jgi:hypothetical protein